MTKAADTNALDLPKKGYQPRALPPIGGQQDDAALCSDIILRKQEAWDVRRNFEEWADEGSQYFHYGTMNPYEDDSIVVNDIQNFIITQTDLETREPPTVVLEAVDTGAPPRVFLNLPLQQRLKLAQQLGIPPEQVSQTEDPMADEPVPVAPLDSESIAKLDSLLQAGILPPDALVSVDAQEAADVFQKVFDVIWKRSKFAHWYRWFSLGKAVYGWQSATYEFDDARKRHIFRNIPLRQVFIDPTAETIEEAAYVIFDLPLDADVAKRLYPQWADQIEQYAQIQGKIQRPPGTIQMGGRYEDVTSFRRRMVVLTFAFYRDQLAYLSPDEALEQGHIEAHHIPTGDYHYDQQGELAEQTRRAFFHKGRFPATEALPPTHKDFTPDHEWPVRECTRQIVAIAVNGVVLEDSESRYFDIPLVLNQNIPVLGKPVGISEARRQRSMQDARNKNLNAAADHSQWFRGPITWYPASAKEKLPEEFADGHMHPGMVFVIPDDVVNQTNGKPMGMLNPPELPAVVLNVDATLKREMNDQSGNMHIMQGRDEGEHSGVAISQLQDAAASMSSFKAQLNEECVEQLAHMGLHSILTRMTVADAAKIVKRYQPHILEQLWAMGPDIEWNFDVSAAAGGGRLKAFREQRDIARLKIGAISMQTFRQNNNIDPQEADRIKSERAAMMLAQPAVGVGGTPQPPAMPQGPAKGGPLGAASA